LVGIAALMVVGFVVLVVALAYDESLARERRREREQRIMRAKAAVRRRRNATRLPASTPRAGREQPALARVMRKAVEMRTGWRDLGHAARVERTRWLGLESTGGQLLVGIVASLVVALLIVALL
jgi:hypothetical protein